MAEVQREPNRLEKATLASVKSAPEKYAMPGGTLTVARRILNAIGELEFPRRTEHAHPKMRA
jgi:hypothetical protein